MIIDATFTEKESLQANFGTLAKGEKGDTPIKFVDYYTEEDQSELVDKVVEELSVKQIEFNDGETIAVKSNTIYVATSEINTLTITYPTEYFICHICFTIANEGDVTITLPESKYIGETPTFANGETWELNIRNGVVVGGKVE